MTDRIVPFLRELHELGWKDASEALLVAIAEVEGADQRFREERVTTLGEELIALVRFHRKQNKAGSN